MTLRVNVEPAAKIKGRSVEPEAAETHVMLERLVVPAFSLSITSVTLSLLGSEGRPEPQVYDLMNLSFQLRVTEYRINR